MLPTGTRLSTAAWPHAATRAVEIGMTVFVLHHGHAIDSDATVLIGPPRSVVAIIKGARITMVPSIYHYEEQS